MLATPEVQLRATFTSRHFGFSSTFICSFFDFFYHINEVKKAIPSTPKNPGKIRRNGKSKKEVSSVLSPVISPPENVYIDNVRS